MATRFHSSNACCELGNNVLMCDLAVEYVVEPRNISIPAPTEMAWRWAGEQPSPASIAHQYTLCAVYWRDPMQVCIVLVLGP